MLSIWRRKIRFRCSAKIWLLPSLASILAVVLLASPGAFASNMERSLMPMGLGPTGIQGISSFDWPPAAGSGQAPQDATGHMWSSNHCWVPIPDNVCGPTDYVGCGAETAAAPAGAVVTQVDVQYRISHTAIGDLRVIFCDDFLSCYTLWNHSGGTDNHLDESVTGIHTWDGKSVDTTRLWGLLAKDCTPTNTGHIEFMRVDVYWSAPTIDALHLSKTLVHPAVGPAAVGDTVRFEIEAQNISAMTITLLPMTDRFDSECLSFAGANPSPDNVDFDEDLLIWYNLGPLAPGATRSVEVEFRATADCDPATNSAAVLGAMCEQDLLVTPMLDEAEVTIVDAVGLRRLYLPLIDATS